MSETRRKEPATKPRPSLVVEKVSRQEARIVVEENGKPQNRHPATADCGVVLLERMLLREMDRGRAAIP